MRRASPRARLDQPKRFAWRRFGSQNAARRGFGVISEPHLRKIHRSV